MNFTTGRTYRFEIKSRRGNYSVRRLKGFNLEYLRHVGEVDLFRHPTAGWLEGFTLRQAEDYDIEEVRA